MRPGRRILLKAAAAAGGLHLAWPLAPGHSPARAREAAEALGVSYEPAPFTLGVASGDPLPTSVLLWTRLAPEPFATEQDLPEVVEVGWVVAEDKALKRVVARGTTAASATLGHSVHVPVGGLEPGRHYWYAFTARGATSRTGRTKTTPAKGARRVRFAGANCQKFPSGFYAALRGIAREELDFVVHLGDYLYEHGPVRGDPVRNHDTAECLTLADYRRRYALYKGDASLRAAHANHPWFLTWDDHEVDNNYTATVGGAPFMQRKQAAYQAWYEHQPHRDGGESTLPDPVLHRRRDIGGLVELTVLDLRSYRSASNPVDGTILGSRQRDWLTRGVAGAPDTWHCWANSIMLGQLRSEPGGTYMFTDQWDGFLAERKDVLTQVQKSGLEDLVVITGDWHSAFVGDIRQDYDDLGTPVLGTEFTAHSVSSGAYRPDWNETNGPLMGAANPHLQYFEGGHYGYDLYEVTPERWTTHLRVIASRDDPVSPVSTLTTFHIDRGKAGAYEDPATAGSRAHYRRDRPYAAPRLLKDGPYRAPGRK